jgi:hypothetical protein
LSTFSVHALKNHTHKRNTHTKLLVPGLQVSHFTGASPFGCCYELSVLLSDVEVLAPENCETKTI